MADIPYLDIPTIHNLRDAGCSDEFIECFACITQEENTVEELDFLSKNRTSLLNSIHENQKRIDCLDYLIYRIKKPIK